jgi:hypothetical protein
MYQTLMSRFFFGILTFSLTKVGMSVFLHLQMLFQEQNRPTHWPVVYETHHGLAENDY